MSNQEGIVYQVPKFHCYRLYTFLVFFGQTFFSEKTSDRSVNTSDQSPSHQWSITWTGDRSLSPVINHRISSLIFNLICWNLSRRCLCLLL